MPCNRAANCLAFALSMIEENQIDFRNGNEARGDCASRGAATDQQDAAARAHVDAARDRFGKAVSVEIGGEPAAASQRTQFACTDEIDIARCSDRARLQIAFFNGVVTINPEERHAAFAAMP